MCRENMIGKILLLIIYLESLPYGLCLELPQIIETNQDSDGKILLHKVELKNVDLLDFIFLFNEKIEGLDTKGQIFRIKIRDPIPRMPLCPIVIDFFNPNGTPVSKSEIFKSKEYSRYWENPVSFSCNLSNMRPCEFLAFISEILGARVVANGDGYLMGSEELLMDHPGYKRYSFVFSEIESQRTLSGLKERLKPFGPSIAFNAKSGNLTLIIDRKSFSVFDEIITQLKGTLIEDFSEPF